MLVGREAERSLIHALLDGARAGRGGALLIRGEAGIGKTALLDDAVAYASELHTVRMVGVEAESEIAFAALDRVVREFRHAADRLPARQQDVLCCPTSTVGAEPDPFAVALALLDLLATAGDEQAALIVIDDAHWIDQPSQVAFAFVGRRLAAEPIAMLVATRDQPQPGRAAPHGIPELRPAGLGAVEALGLLRARGRPLAPEVASELARMTAGNPLALEEAGRLLSDGQLTGTEQLPARVPTGEGIESAFLDRLERLSPVARQALIVAAASDCDDLPLVAAALDEAGVSVQALQEAASTDLVRVADGALSFRHPLARSAVYHAALPEERRRAHDVLARTLNDPEYVDRRAWHLAAAAGGPDEAIASELEASARQALRRGGPGAAAATLRRAADLTPRTHRRVERLLEAADAAQRAGRPDETVRLADEALRLTDDPDQRARLYCAQGLAESSRDPIRALGLFLAAAELMEPRDPEQAGLMLAQATTRAGAGGDFRRARALTERVLALVDTSSPLAQACAVIALAFSGRHDDARTLLGSLDDVDAVSVLRSERLVAAFAYALLVAEHFDEAETLLDRTISEARTAAAIGVLPYLLQIDQLLLFETGRWIPARVAAEEAIALAEETGQAAEVAWVQAHLAVIAGAQGREEECLRLVARIDEAAHGLGARQMPIIARSGLGLLHLGAGAPLSAADEFEAIRRAVVECGGQQPLWTRWLPNLAEAYVRGGRSEEAEALLDGVPEWSDADALSWGAAADARCRGLLEDTASFDAHFERALELHGHAGNPFERARTELCYGERLRRARRRADARRHLRDAFVTFERLDAAPWAGRARGELEATGLSLEPSQPQPLAELTPHELRIAGVVASGAKNQEIAARLFVTPKTVEYHLRSIYRKLNIRSRSELVRLYLAESQLEASSASA